MNFAEQLKEKKDLRVVEFADEFLEYIKPRLIASSEKGYSSLSYKIDTDLPIEKEKLQLYSAPLFTDQLNKNLDGVKVTFKEKFVESIILKGRGWYKYYLLFEW